MSAAKQTSSQSLDQKYHRMRDILRSLRRVAVAFSAGVDSTLVLKVAVDVLGPENVVAVTGRSASLAQAELQQAGQLAAACGVEHVLIDTKEFDQPDYLANPPERCYYCKTELYGQMAAFTAERGLAALVDPVVSPNQALC